MVEVLLAISELFFSVEVPRSVRGGPLVPNATSIEWSPHVAASEPGGRSHSATTSRANLLELFIAGRRDASGLSGRELFSRLSWWELLSRLVSLVPGWPSELVSWISQFSGVVPWRLVIVIVVVVPWLLLPSLLLLRLVALLLPLAA